MSTMSTKSNTRVKFSYVSLENRYQWVNSEEGGYEGFTGYFVHAAVHSEEILDAGTAKERVLQICDHYAHFFTFQAGDDVKAYEYLAKVEQQGDMNPEHWTFTNRDSGIKNAEPYWATEQFAQRERTGTL